jgi:hypothetical protein
LWNVGFFTFFPAGLSIRDVKGKADDVESSLNVVITKKIQIKT